jgi:hypothetical protein
MVTRDPDPAALGELVDDFSGPLDTSVWNVSPGATISGGQLVLACTSSYSGIGSIASYDMTGSHVAVQLVSVPIDTNGGTETALSFKADDSNLLMIDKRGANLLCDARVGGVDTTATVAWDPAAMAWWRLREDSGTVYFETAPDGSTWTTQLSVATPTFATDGTAGPQVNCGYFGTEPSPGSAVLEGFNLYPGAVSSTAVALRLEYSLDGAVWHPVTGSSSVVRSTASANITDGAATTQQLGSGLFAAGTVDEVDGVFASVSLLPRFRTEVEASCQIRAADVTLSSTLLLRVALSDGTPLDAYVSAAEVIVDKPAIMQRAYRARYDDGSETAARWIAAQDTPWGEFPGRPFRIRYLLQRVASAAELSSFTDAFGATSIDPLRWRSVGTVSQAGGVLSLGCTPAYSSLTSFRSYSLVDSHVAVHVTGLPTDTGGSTETLLTFLGDADNLLSIEKRGAASLVCTSRDAGVPTTSTVAWDGPNMAWWRIREFGSVVYFETSADGATWATRATVPTPSFAGAGAAQLSCGYSGTETSPGSATFDDFNLYTDGPPSPVATVTDWQTFYSLNGATWLPVTSSSAVVRATASPFVTEDAATTQQLGAGTFVAGSTDETDGFFSAVSLHVEDQTELEGCLSLVSADVHPGDSVAIVITRGNFEFLEVYNRTPTLTVVAYPVTYWDGSVEHPAVVTVWDGSAEVPMAFLEVT